VTRAHLIAWRDELGRRGLGGATIRHRLKQPDRPKLRDFSELSAQFIHGIDGVNLQRKPAAR
jgi:hypothetical protein